MAAGFRDTSRPLVKRREPDRADTGPNTHSIKPSFNPVLDSQAGNVLSPFPLPILHWTLTFFNNDRERPTWVRWTSCTCGWSQNWPRVASLIGTRGETVGQQTISNLSHSAALQHSTQVFDQLHNCLYVSIRGWPFLVP